MNPSLLSFQLCSTECNSNLQHPKAGRTVQGHLHTGVLLPEDALRDSFPLAPSNSILVYTGHVKVNALYTSRMQRIEPAFWMMESQYACTVVRWSPNYWRDLKGEQMAAAGFIERSVGGKSAIICKYSISWEEIPTHGHTTFPCYGPIYICIAAKCTFYHEAT